MDRQLIQDTIYTHPFWDNFVFLKVTVCVWVFPGKIVSVSGDDPLYLMGKIDFGGVQKDISLAYVPEARVGEYVVVHAGFAISVIDEEEAMQVFEYLKEMGELAELEDAPAAPSES